MTPAPESAARDGAGTAPPFELRVRVQDGDIDELGHVNNLVYLRWVQDVAVAHWTAAADPEDQASLYWVIRRHEIDYRRPALRGDDVRLRTWVGTASRRVFERHTEILHAGTGRLLARALTFWVPMDRLHHRPTDVRPAVRARFSVPGAANRSGSGT